MKRCYSLFAYGCNLMVSYISIFYDKLRMGELNLPFRSIPIPIHGHIEKWEQIKIKENNQRLVKVNKVDPRYLVEEPNYYSLGLTGALKHCYVREEVAIRLVKAAKLLLPNGYKLMVWDGYRPFELQQALFTQQYDRLSNANPSLPQQKLIELTKRYVSHPSMNTSHPAPHITGGAVDLTIIDEKGVPLFMGTDFDSFTQESSTRYYEEKLENGTTLEKDEDTALKNRRVLFHALTSVGFTNYPDEWWHFDYGNQWWAKQANIDHAIYGLANLEE